MIRKIVTALALISLAFALVLFAVANRQAVTVSFDPFDQAVPAFLVSLRLYQLVFIVLVGGVLLGGCAAWQRQSKWRCRARRLEAEARTLRAHLSTQDVAIEPPAGLEPPVASSRLTIPPSAA